MQKSMYSLPTLIKVVGYLPSPDNYILNTFFVDGEPFATEHVEVQTMKGNKPLAPYVSELQPGKVVMRGTGTVKIYTPALVKPARPITLIDIRSRQVGETLYNPTPPDVRARKMLAKDMVELNDSIIRRKIQQGSELIFTGKITQIGEGVSQVIDYDFTNKFTLSGTDLWSDQNSDPIKFLSDRRLAIMASGAPTPNVILADHDAAVALMRHPAILKLADNKGVDIGNIDTRLLPEGVTHHGYLRDVGMDVFSYVGRYTDDDGVEHPFIPAGSIAILSSNDPFTFHYGAITIMEPKTEEFVLVQGQVVPQSWATREPAQRWLQLQSRPLAVPANVDGWAVAKVLK